MPDPQTARTLIVVLLRLFGTSGLLAVIFVVAPNAWMRDIHAGLGLGPMADSPVVWYLARSTSAFYAGLGGLFWLLSFDPARHRDVLRYLGAAVCLFGLALFAIDYLEGLPLWWTFWEGPVVTAYGAALFMLSGRLAVERPLVPAPGSRLPPRTRR